ncbi:hypothetical protein HPB47_003279, partial [Ixodes persulcatus]
MTRLTAFAAACEQYLRSTKKKKRRAIRTQLRSRKTLGEYAATVRQMYQDPTAGTSSSPSVSQEPTLYRDLKVSRRRTLVPMDKFGITWATSNRARSTSATTPGTKASDPVYTVSSRFNGLWRPQRLDVSNLKRDGRGGAPYRVYGYDRQMILNG